MGKNSKIMRPGLICLSMIAVLSCSDFAFARRAKAKTELLIYGDYQRLQNRVNSIAEDPKRSLLIFDLDKTLTDSSNNVPLEVASEIISLLESGIDIAIVSGSNISAIKKKLLDGLFASVGDLNIFRRLLLYPNIATERYVYNEHIGGFVKDNEYAEYDFDDKQRETVIDLLGRIIDRYNPQYKDLEIKLALRIEDGFACIVGMDVEGNRYEDIPDFNELVAEIEESLGYLGLGIRGSGKFAIDVTRQGVNKGIAVADILEGGKKYEHILSFGDSVANNAGDWFLHKPNSSLAVPFVYVGYRTGFDKMDIDPSTFFATENQGPKGVLKVLELFRVPLAISSINKFLAKQDELTEKADLLLLLGSPDLEVAYQAAELYRQGRAEKVLISGGGLIGNKSEAVVFKRILMEQGVPENNIIIETESKDTDENMKNSIRVLEENGLFPQSIILLQKPLAQRRSEAIYRKYFSEDIKLISCAPYIPDLTVMSPDERLETIVYSLREIYRFFTLGPLGDNSIPEVTVPNEIIKASKIILGHLKSTHGELFENKPWLGELENLLR